MRKEEARHGRLCGFRSERIEGAPNLHELGMVKCQAHTDKPGCGREQDLFGKKPCLPVFQESPVNDPDVVFIDIRESLKDGSWVGAICKRLNDLMLDPEGNLGVRNDRGQEERVGSSTDRTLYPTDQDFDLVIIGTNPAGIIRVFCKTPRMATGTDEAVKLEGVNHRIIEILRKLIVFFDKNRYHSPVQHVWRQKCCCGTAGRLCEGLDLLSFCDNNYDNSEGTGTVNLSENASD